MTAADRKQFGCDVAGEAIFMNHCTPALHALVGILRISPRQVALQVEITPGRMSHYLNEIDPIPHDRRKRIAEFLSVVLDGLEESVTFAKRKAKKGKLKEGVGADYTEASILVAEAILEDCRRLLAVEQADAERLKDVESAA